MNKFETYIFDEMSKINNFQVFIKLSTLNIVVIFSLEIFHTFIGKSSITISKFKYKLYDI